MMKQGFSLVELSIVLVILGLLTGGILGGQNLMRAAELRSVTTDFQRYHTAVMTFRDKYFALPGDMPNATKFWGDRAAGPQSCADATVADGTPGTCNGDGNGFIRIGPEIYLAWQHLANAGLLEGTYTGLNGGGTGCTSTCDSIAGVNVPASKLNKGGYDFFLMGQDPVSNAARYFDVLLTGQYNALIFGSKTTDFWHLSAIISPEDAWNIDSKMDDGRPQYGKLFTRRDTNCTTTNVSATAEYKLSESANNCLLVFKY